MVEPDHCLFFIVRLFVLGTRVNFREIVNAPPRMVVGQLGLLVLLHWKLITPANRVAAISAVVSCQEWRLTFSRRMTGVAPIPGTPMRAKKLLA